MIDETMPGDEPQATIHTAAFEQRESPRANVGATRLVDVCAASATCFVAAWSLLELRWELDNNSSTREISAILVSKTLLLLMAGLSLRGWRVASYALLFVCGMSVLAMAPEISGEYERSPALAVVSAIECVGKLVAFAFIALSFRRQEASPET
jgi:hypothetical protein